MNYFQSLTLESCRYDDFLKIDGHATKNTTQ